MTKRRWFTKAFDDEAIRLVATSGRTQGEIAADSGIGLSTLVRWISRSRGRVAEMPDNDTLARQAHVGVEEGGCHGAFSTVASTDFGYGRLRDEMVVQPLSGRTADLKSR